MRIDRNAEPTKYSISSVNDAPNPFMLYYYPAEDALYALIRALPHTGRSHRVRSNASSRDEYQVESAKPEYYIARFDLSGTYRGAQKLEVPFMPVQIGAFSSGDFLVSGLDQDTGEPRLALVNRRGQFIRTVELEGDITGKSAAVKEQGKKWFAGGSLRGMMLSMISASDMVADRGNLLLVRKQSEITVFEVSPAGEVRRVKIKNIMEGAKLDSIKSADGRWLVQLTKDRDDGMGFTIYSYTVDPQDGRVLERLVYDDAGTWGLVCYNGGEFTTLQEQEGAVLLLRGTIEAKTSVGPGKPE